MNLSSKELPFPIVNNSVRDMRIRISIAGGAAELSIPSGGRVVLIGLLGDVQFEVTFGGLDEIPPQASRELHINDTDI